MRKFQSSKLFEQIKYFFKDAVELSCYGNCVLMRSPKKRA